jgi:hypothetical protein
MKTIKLALFALAATLTVGAANADEARKMDVIVVTAPRPDAIETPTLTSLEQPLPVVDFGEFKIERPTLDPSTVESKPERIELAAHDEPEPRS